MSSRVVLDSILSRKLDLSTSTLPLDAVLDVLPAAVYTTDANGVLQHYNPAAAELWGRTPAVGDDKWCGSWSLYHTDGRPMPHEECPMARALKTGEPVRGEEAIAERPDGSRVTFLACPTPIRDADGNIIGAVNMLIDITERKAAEDALRKREAELSDFIENANIGLHWVGPDGIIKWANKAEMDMLGYTAEEYIGQHIARFHADKPVIDDILARLARQETLVGYEARLRCKDGTIKPVKINSSVYTENGRFIHTRCFTTEISAQKTNEQRLTMSLAVSQRLSTATSIDEAAGDVLEILSTSLDADVAELWLREDAGPLRCRAFHSRLPDKRVRPFRERTESMTLARGEGLPGLSWEAMKPVWIAELADSSTFLRSEHARSLALSDGFAFPILSGSECLGAVSLMMNKSAATDPLLMKVIASLGYKLGQFIERAREAQASRLLASVVESSRDAIVSASLDNIVTSWNAGAERLFGFSAEEIVGSCVKVILPEDCMEQRARHIEAMKRGGLVEPFETVRLNKAGELIPVSLGYSPVRDAEGKLVGIAATIRDISAKKQAEEMLVRRMRQLQAVSELGYLALSGDSTQALFDAVVKRIAVELDVEMVKVLELLPGGERVLLRSGVGWKEGLVGKATVDTGLNSQAGYTLKTGHAVIVKDLATETRFSGPPLLRDHGVVSGVSVVISGPGGAPFGVLGAHTRQRRDFVADDVNFVQSIANILATSIEGEVHEDRQKLLIHELSHRVKNLLMVIQSIALQTGQWSPDFETFKSSFQGRLKALSQAHDLLTSNHWSGADIQALATLVTSAQVETSRFRFDLEQISLSPNGTQMLTMVLHELTTNAVKYGALSNPSGTVAVEGRLGEDRGKPAYRVRWQERGGPPVSKPKRSGFGTALVKGTITKHCGGSLDLNWHPQGVEVEFAIPLAALGEGAN